MKKIKLTALAFTFCSFFIHSGLVTAGMKTDCSSDVSEGVSWSYCISKSPGSKNPDFLYFFHGIYNSEYAWQADSDEVQAHWAKEKQDAPTVISISFGSVWFLAPKEALKEYQGYMETFIHSIIPRMENKLGGLKGRRLLAGMSMGGFNAAELFLWFPKEFDRVALVCPALAMISPFASDQEYQAYIKRTGASSQYVSFARRTAKATFRDDASWKTVDPFNIISAALGSTLPKLYVSIGEEDEFGFFEGAQAFAELVRAKGTQGVEWYPMKGGHCQYDTSAFANFIVSH